jgi:ribonuclease III
MQKFYKEQKEGSYYKQPLYINEHHEKNTTSSINGKKIPNFKYQTSTKIMDNINTRQNCPTRNQTSTKVLDNINTRQNCPIRNQTSTKIMDNINTRQNCPTRNQTSTKVLDNINTRQNCPIRNQTSTKVLDNINTEQNFFIEKISYKKQKSLIHSNMINQNITTIFLYEFQNIELLKTALLHPSKEKNKGFQRLEFIGDKILAIHLSLMIYSLYPDKDEGGLSVMFADLSSANTIAEIVSFHISPYINYTGAINNNIIADTFEAIIAAIHLDGGHPKAIIELLWYPYINNNKNHNYKSPKNILQEITNNKCHYSVQEKDMKNNKKFVAEVYFNDVVGMGEGFSKKDATSNAANNLIEKLK